MSSLITPFSLKLQEDNFHSLYHNTISLENGRFLICTPYGQLTKQSISNTGGISFEYFDTHSNEPSKSISIKIGKDTPLFRRILSVENNEKIKTLILEYASVFFKAHKAGESGFKRITGVDDIQKSFLVERRSKTTPSTTLEVYFKYLDPHSDEASKNFCIKIGQEAPLFRSLQFQGLLALPSSTVDASALESALLQPSSKVEVIPAFSTLEDNAARIEVLINGYIAQGEGWKKGFVSNPKVTIGERNLRPPEIITDCMEAMTEIIRLDGAKTTHDDKTQALLEKKIVNSSTEVIVTGDIHGDGVSVARMLEKLQVDGKLDYNFKLVSNTELVFLGDYVDKGPDSWAVLNMLARLKLNNMDTVHLIRGNHENMKLIDQESKRCGEWLSHDDTGDKSEVHLLDLFFNTLPNAIFLGAKKDGKTEYDIYTHGAVPLSFNPNYLLRQEDGMHVISKDPAFLENHAFTFVDTADASLQDLACRVQAAILKHQTIDRAEVMLYLRNYGLNENGNDFSKEKENFEYILESKDQVNREWDWGDITDYNDSFSIGRSASVNVMSLIEWMKYSEALSSPTPNTSQEEQAIFFKRVFKGHSHQQKKQTKDESTRELYFLDTDLYDNGEFVMYSHTMDGSNLAGKDKSEKVYARSYNKRTGAYDPFVERNFIKKIKLL
jgi:hypothetical protein